MNAEADRARREKAIEDFMMSAAGCLFSGKSIIFDVLNKDNKKCQVNV